MTATVALSRRQLAEILGVTVFQVRHADRVLGITYSVGMPANWTPEQVRRLQVATKLAEQIPTHDAKASSTAFPAMVRAVFDTTDNPKPPCWVVYKDGGVCYVHFSADLFRFVGDGAVVAKIDNLWTEGP